MSAESAAPQRVAFFTGFPGFIGRRLIQRLATDDADLHFALLVQPQLRHNAEAQLAELDEAVPGLSARAQLLEGDITLSDLGLGEQGYATLCEQVTEAWHLAAIYDLSVKSSVAYRVNVVGTANVLDLCEAAGSFQRLHYVSTCYVSGDRTGRVREAELDCDQGFKNHYEATKFWAELEVQRRMSRLPTTVYRPGIVVGDSRTGETDKYDGPYYIIRTCMQFPDHLPIPALGSDSATFNVVPVDFVVDSMVTIGAREDTVGKVFALADPNPLTTRQFISLIMRTLGKREGRAAVPPNLMMTAMSVPAVQKYMQVPAESVMYLNHPAHYDTSSTQAALEGSGVRCPSPTEYLPTLVEFMKGNPIKTFLDGRKF